MASPAPRPTSAQNPLPAGTPSFSVRLQNFWQRVTEGLELNELWTQFKLDAQTSYRLYSRDLAARAPQASWRRNFWHTLKEFAWAILEKLTPARRVLLLLGIVLLLLPSAFTYHDADGVRVATQFPFSFYGSLILLFLLTLEIADRVVMKRDLEIARDIQRWLLPSAPPQVPGLTIAFATRPANTVAGDYYDVFPRPPAGSADPRYLIAVADVAGKSIPAALLMATFQASLRTLSTTACALPELVSGMNRYACSHSQNGARFTTAFLAEFDSATRTLSYINAGHNAPMLRHSSGEVEHLVVGGLPLGIQSEVPYQAGSVVLRAGDWLVIFTDGLVEAFNRNNEEYGEQRMLRVLETGNALSPAELLRRMMADVDAFVGDTPQHDDITCMLLRVG